MLAVTGTLTAPAPFRYLTDTVCGPSPAGTWTALLVENRLNAPYGPPLTEIAMSETGSALVGFVAANVRFSVVWWVEAAPPSIVIVPLGRAVSRYSVYPPEPPLLLTTTTPPDWLGSVPG